MTFAALLKERARLVDRAMDEALPPAGTYPEVIHEAMRYSVFAGGKRLRPILALAGAELNGGRMEAAMPAAIALELVHTYSLIHDDLPAMDNDDLRRGRPTSHRVFGENIAILAGDALLTHAFYVLASACDIPGEVSTLLVKELALASGTMGMIGGQVADVTSSRDHLDREKILYIHRHKTEALIRASVRMGAISAGASAADLAALSEYAAGLGLAFQIVDDILNEVGDREKLGKAVGSDSKLQKATYTALFGLERARDDARYLIEKAKGSLDRYGERGNFLCDLADYVLKRDS